MGYLPASVIEQAGQYLLCVLQAKNEVDYSFFYDGSDEAHQRLNDATGLDDWYGAEGVVDEAAYQLAEAGYVSIRPLDSKLADDEQDYQIVLTAFGRASLESGGKPEFEGVDL